MSQTNPTAARFRELFLDGKWIANTNYKELLEQVEWKQATKQVGPLNTIAALTFHINYYVAGVLQVFEGGTLDIRDKYSFDAPTIETPDAWHKLRKDLQNNSEKFAQQLDRMSAEDLQRVFIDEKYGTYSRNIEGMIEHGYYHLGQISMINKLLAEGS